MVIFSPGAEGTTITPQDLADQAVAAGVPVYPVALPVNEIIWYVAGQPFQWGRCLAPPPEHGFIDCPLNTPFQSVGNQTGGGSFEAARRQVLQDEIGGDPLDRFSMTGGQVNDILQTVKSQALARFTSTYTVWFAPSPSASPRKHKLEVRLAEKSSGKVTDGKRSAIY